jgi:S1-C subfamily serine protease
MTEPRELAPAAPDPDRPGRTDRVVARLRRAVPFAWGVAGAVAVLLVVNLVAPAQPPLTSAQLRESIDAALASITPEPARSQLIYDVVRPSLVLIETGPPGATTELEQLGSGVIVSGRGEILTSWHVVAAADELRVTFADGTQSPAMIVAQVPEDDIAVLVAAAPPPELFPAVLGNPGAVRVGDETYALGNPLGLTGSITSGVISGLGRTFRLQETSQTLDDLIQFDAAVNPGSSGGPLLDRDGRVIGIVAALLNPTEERVFAGVGLAVRIDVAGGAAELPPF